MKLSFSRSANKASNVDGATCHCVCTMLRPSAAKTVIVFKTLEETALRTSFHGMVHFLRPYQRRKKIPSSEIRIVPCSEQKVKTANPIMIEVRKLSKRVWAA